MDITNTIGYYLRPNPTNTAAEAPYLPKLVPNGVANMNDIAERIAASLPVSAERAKLLIREAFAEAVALAAQGYTADMGALRMKARIPGSMPCEDTPFDPESNACVIELYADSELDGAFEALKPVKLSAEQLASAIKVSNVTDVATMSIGEIHGTDEFILTGNSVTLDAPGEDAKLADRKTGETLATAEVVTVSKGQRATCRFNPGAAEIPAGAYWLVVTTFGLIGESAPRVFRKPVTLTEAIPVHVPTVTNVTFDGTPFDEAESIPASGSTVDADNWSRTPDDRLVVTYPDEAGGTHVIDKALEDGGGGSGYTGDLRGEMEEKEIPLDAEVELKLVLHGGVEGSPDQVFTTQLALAR